MLRHTERFARAVDAPSLELAGSVEIGEVYVSAGKKGPSANEVYRKNRQSATGLDPEVLHAVKLSLSDFLLTVNARNLSAKKDCP